MRLVIFLLILIQSLVFAEDLTLESCYKLARENYPTLKQLKTYEEISSLKQSNLSAGYYPDLQLIGQAQYQSDVTKIQLNIPNIKIPTMPEPAKDQYKIGLNINQSIWDGGMISSQKDFDIVQTELNKQNVEIDLYSLKQKINELFFGAIILQNRLQILNDSKKDLVERFNQIKIKAESGAVLESNANVLEAEIYKIDQNARELQTNRKSMLDVLGIMTGKLFEESTVLVLPEKAPKTNFANRPETRAFGLSRDNLEKSKDLIDSKYNPKFSAFLQAMYGRPGFNLFDNDFQAFYLAGIRASWNFWNWNTSSREKQIIEANKTIVNSQEAAFNRNILIASRKYLNEIERLNEIILADDKIIELREKVVKVSSNQMENGAITASEYLTEFTQLLIAKQNKVIHRIELQQNIVNNLTLLGIE